MSDRDKVLSNQMLLDKFVVVRSRELVMDLVVFNMPNFTVILSIDFLSKYGTNIDCKKKKVWFSLDNNDKFTFRKGQVLNIMVNSVNARKMLSKGYMGYLA